MPSASTAKLEKQASSEAGDPIKQGITLVEHKIRNLLKKKGRLDDYREKQKNGIVLEPEQKLAILKYDEVCQNLSFAQELSKQLNGIAVEAEKGKKKKEKKEAYEREQQEVNKVKEILIIQDVLASMGTDSVREDFLAGRNKAVKLTEAELQYLDDLFVEVSPKREPEEGQPPFPEQTQNAAKHLLNIVEGKDKEIVGTKYSVLKVLIEKISNCGYFDQTAVEESVPQEAEAPVAEQPAVVEQVEPEPEEVATEPVPSATFQPSGAPVMEPVVAPVVETAGLYISQRPMADVLTNVMGGGPTTFNFIQESELEPEVAVVPATPLPIPTQTFTNANFAPPPGAAAPVYPPHQPPQTEVLYAAPAQYSPVPPPQPQPALQPTAAPAAMPLPVPTQQFDNSSTFQTTKSQSGAGDWNDTTEQNSDWAMQVEQSEQNRWNENTQPSDDWADNSNDGFQPASRGGGRGGRGRGGGSDRGRGGPRGGRGSYQNGRGNYGNNQTSRGGGSYYRNNNEGGNNYYQNGYQSRGDGERGDRGDRGERSYRGGGERRGGPRGGQQDRGGNRGAPRGSGGRGGNPRGGSRGNRGQ